MTTAELLTGVFLATGVFFVLVSAIGFARLPDVFSRLHVTGVMDTMGVPLIMVGAAIHLGPQLVAAKLMVAVLFLSITSPLAAHLLARAALEAGHQPGVIDESVRFEGRSTEAEDQPDDNAHGREGRP